MLRLRAHVLVLGFGLLLMSNAPPLAGLLFFPASSILQLTSSVSVPIEEYFPDRRIIFDWAFQMNYDLPADPADFYNTPIWPLKYNQSLTRRSLEAGDGEGEGGAERSAPSRSDLFARYDLKPGARRHPSDFTAGELYQGIEDLLTSYGFHETCLLRSVCDLARHPFADDQQNVLTEILTFLLTPSLHAGFDESETLYREVYEEAELRGVLGEDECHALYSDCQHDLLGAITGVAFSNG